MGSLEELKKIEPKLTNDVLKVFDLKNSVNSKKSYGGTAFDNIKKMIMKYKKQKLTIDKVTVQNIAKKFDTPAYCYSYSQLKKNIDNFKKNFKSFSPLICFAIKSNTNVNLIKEIAKFGLGADVVSLGELMKALKAGIKPNKIVFSGVGKTSEEIKYAINKKILLINAESKSEIIEIERIAKLKKMKVHIGIRLN